MRTIRHVMGLELKVDLGTLGFTFTNSSMFFLVVKLLLKYALTTCNCQVTLENLKIRKRNNILDDVCYTTIHFVLFPLRTCHLCSMEAQ